MSNPHQATQALASANAAVTFLEQQLEAARAAREKAAREVASSKADVEPAPPPDLWERALGPAPGASRHVLPASAAAAIEAAAVRPRRAFPAPGAPDALQLPTAPGVPMPVPPRFWLDLSVSLGADSDSGSGFPAPMVSGEPTPADYELAAHAFRDPSRSPRSRNVSPAHIPRAVREPPPVQRAIPIVSGSEGSIPPEPRSPHDLPLQEFASNPVFDVWDRGASTKAGYLRR